MVLIGSIDLAEFRTMQDLMIWVQRGEGNPQSARQLLPKMKTQLVETTELFKGKERKALTDHIQQTKQEIYLRPYSPHYISEADFNKELKQIDAEMRRVLNEIS